MKKKNQLRQMSRRQNAYFFVNLFIKVLQKISWRFAVGSDCSAVIGSLGESSTLLGRIMPNIALFSSTLNSETHELYVYAERRSHEYAYNSVYAYDSVARESTVKCTHVASVFLGNVAKMLIPLSNLEKSFTSFSYVIYVYIDQKNSDNSFCTYKGRGRRLLQINV